MRHHAALVFLVAVFAGAVIGIGPAKAGGDTPAARRATKALDILEAQGYAAGLSDKSFGALQNFRQQGKDYVATIGQSGRSFVVTVDPDTGQVTRQQ